MSQYRGYYTSAKSVKPSEVSTLPFIINTDDDFEYDSSYVNHNKRSISEAELYDSSNDNQLNSTHLGKSKSLKVGQYYTDNNKSSTSNGYHSYRSSVSPSENTQSSNNSQNGIDTKCHMPNYINSASCNNQLVPELKSPVFQTTDRCNKWGYVKPTLSHSVENVALRSEKLEQWAWGTGNKWVGASGPRPKLNVYSAAPTVELFTSAARVKGGIGEKLLQKMGWREGEGLGKLSEGSIDPIEFSEIKTDRKGLVSHEDGVKIEGELHNKEKVKSKFAEIKSTSFWNWHGAGMKGPENFNARLKQNKKIAKVKEAPILDISGKHPVSALMELCSKKKWKEPKFTSDPSSRGFKFKVEVNGKEYVPDTSSDNKKSAKAECAKSCLLQMGWKL